MAKIFEEKLGVANTSILSVSRNQLPDVVDIPKENLSEKDERYEKDFELAREGILRNFKNIDEAVQHAFMIAKDNESAQSFMALNSLMKTMTDTAKVMMDIHQSKKIYNKEEKKPEEKKTGDINIQNAVFTGTPRELKEFINNLKKGEETKLIESSPVTYVDVSDDKN